MIKFSLPDYHGHYKFIQCFLNIYQRHPEYFYENRKIDSAYGMPPNLIWNGGRAILKTGFTQEESYCIFDSYSIYENFHIRHTCTNCLLTPEMYNDYNCNLWIDYCQREHDGIIINDDNLLTYLQEKYPCYDYIISTTKQLDNIEEYNKYTKNYLTVLDYRFNHDEDFIKQLKYPQNIEILCAEPCVDNCPYREEHYRLISAAQLNIPHMEYFTCPHGDSETDISLFYERYLNRKHAISTDYVDYLYNTYGITNFKISGRVSNPVIYIESIVYYLIKPEYQNIVRNILFTDVIFNKVV